MADQGVAWPLAAPESSLARLTRLGGKLLSLSALLLAARLLGAAAEFLVQVVLARWLPPGDLGVYYTATSLAVIGGVVAAHGYPSIATRFVSRYRKPSGKPMLRSFVRLAQIETMLLALAITALVIAGASIGPWFEGHARTAIILSAVTIPFVAAFRIYGSLATATRAFALAYLPDVCLKPMVLLAALGCLMLAGLGISLTAVMICLAVATVLLSGAQYVLLRRGFPVSLSVWRSATRALSVKRITAKWRREAHAVLLVAIFSQFFPDLTILIATPFLKAADVGVFGLCLKLAFLAGFFVLMTQNIATPDLADAFAKRSERRNGGKSSAASMAAATGTLIALLFCVVFGEPFLRVFGAHFATGQTALVLLMAAQLVRAVFGPNNTVLTLIGEQRLNLVLTTASVVVLVVSTAVLGTLFGLDGAAAAVLLAMLFWSAASAVALYRKTGLRVDLFATNRA